MIHFCIFIGSLALGDGMIDIINNHKISNNNAIINGAVIWREVRNGSNTIINALTRETFAFIWDINFEKFFSSHLSSNISWKKAEVVHEKNENPHAWNTDHTIKSIKL